MADLYAVSGETLTGIADAIRSKTGSDEPMTVAAMVSAIEGLAGDPIAFRFVLADMTNVTGTTSNNQRVFQDFDNYWNTHKPAECENGTWVFVAEQPSFPQTYSIPFFIVINGAVQVFFRKSYSALPYPLTDMKAYSPDDTSTWCWASYSDNTTYYGAKLY